MIMTEKETLLECISMIKAEAEIETVYGDRWRIEDYRLRRSLVAGQICLLFADLERLKAKAQPDRFPGPGGPDPVLKKVVVICHGVIRTGIPASLSSCRSRATSLKNTVPGIPTHQAPSTLEGLSSMKKHSPGVRP